MSLKTSEQSLMNAIPDALYERVLNLKNAVKGYKHRIAFSPDIDGVIKVTDQTDTLYICRRSRIWLYKKSIAKRLEKLWRSYKLDKIEDGLSGAFIDCGANIGELGHQARAKGFDYHAFEPEPLEAICCDLNNFEGALRTNRKALWSENTTLKFYSKPDSADGSLFETEGFTGHREVEAVTLDSYVQMSGITQIAVLKLEAEGAEPEILAGAKQALAMTRYVTVDCGFERGMAQESTLVDVINMLMAAGFKAVDWNHGLVRILFKNTKL